MSFRKLIQIPPESLSDNYSLLAPVLRSPAKGGTEGGTKRRVAWGILWSGLSYFRFAQQLDSCMSYVTKIINRCVHGPGFQMRVCRAPHAEIHYWTPTALFQELSPIRAHLPHQRDKRLPGLFEASPLEIIDTIRMPEGGAQSKKSVIADVEIVISRPAVKKMVTAGEE